MEATRRPPNHRISNGDAKSLISQKDSEDNNSNQKMSDIMRIQVRRIQTIRKGKKTEKKRKYEPITCQRRADEIRQETKMIESTRIR